MVLCVSPHMCDNETKLAILMAVVQVINNLQICKFASLQLENSTYTT
jgi:hypothetical protein